MAGTARLVAHMYVLSRIGEARQSLESRSVTLGDTVPERRHALTAVRLPPNAGLRTRKYAPFGAPPAESAPVFGGSDRCGAEMMRTMVRTTADGS